MLQPNKRSIFKGKKDNYPERKLWSVKRKKIASVLIATNIAIQLMDTLILVIKGSDSGEVLNMKFFSANKICIIT